MKPMLLSCLALFLLAGTACSRTQAAAAVVDGPSFPCSKARTQAERWICGSNELATLDGILGRYYPAIGAGLPTPQRRCLARQQQAWLTERRNRCTSVPCLEQAYLQRLSELESLLPGALQDRRLDAYPPLAVPRLLAILPVDPQQPAPTDPLQQVQIQGRPLEDEGGYLLVTDEFDTQAWKDFVQLQGDEDGLRARFGEGPVQLRGIAGSFSGQDLDTHTRAAIEAVAAAGGELQVTGWAEYTDAAPPTVNGRECAYVHGLP